MAAGTVFEWPITLTSRGDPSIWRERAISSAAMDDFQAEFRRERLARVLRGETRWRKP
jgi:hypothetical protein